MLSHLPVVFFLMSWSLTVSLHSKGAHQIAVLQAQVLKVNTE